MTKKDNEVWNEICAQVDRAADDPSMRVCAVCLCATPRATYDEHMQEHGYETINITGPDRCQCPACKVVPHWSSCAVHNAPAYPPGPCDCGALEGKGPKLD